MKILYREEYDPDSTVTFDAGARLSYILVQLNHILDMLRCDRGEIVASYIGQLEILIKRHEIVVEHPCATGEFVEMPVISRLYRDAYLTMLGVDANASPEDIKAVTVKTATSLRSRLCFMYFQAKALEPFMGKDIALEYFRKYVDDMTVSGVAKVSHVESLSELVSKGSLTGDFAGSFDVIAFELDEGRVGMKVNRCRWIEVLREVAEPDYIYSVTCHYDFAAAGKMNPNFALTREGTIGGGRRYCDFIWHDRRCDAKLAHEPAKFWDGL